MAKAAGGTRGPKLWHHPLFVADEGIACVLARCMIKYKLKIWIYCGSANSTMVIVIGNRHILNSKNCYIRRRNKSNNPYWDKSPLSNNAFSLIRLFWYLSTSNFWNSTALFQLDWTLQIGSFQLETFKFSSSLFSAIFVPSSFLYLCWLIQLCIQNKPTSAQVTRESNKT